MTQVRKCQALRLPSDPNPYRATQPFRRMHQIKQRRQTTQLLILLTVLRAFAGSLAPVGGVVGFNEGSRPLRVLLEVTLEFLARFIE